MEDARVMVNYYTGIMYTARNLCTKLILKVTTVSLYKNRVRFLIKCYCYQILHSSNYFSTYSPPLWGTYRSGAQVFVYPPQRVRPPAMLATTDNVIEQSPWNLRKVQGQIRNCETSSRTLLLTLRTKSSFTKHERPLRTSSCTFSRPSLNIRTHFLTMPSTIALSPYTWQIW